MKNVKMQCIDLFDDNENPVHCPLCGVTIAAGCGEEDISEWRVGNCEHLLFTAIDEIGFDYRSERFNSAVQAALSKKTAEEREELENDVHELTALVEIPDAFMFQSFMGHPAEQTTYVGFAPVRNES